jgi:hypothetical protein
MRRWITAFWIVQLVGIACSWFWQHPFSPASSFLWGTGLLTLFPGNLLGGWTVQRLFWQNHLTIGSMSVIATLLAVIVNAGVWFMVVKLCL